MSPAHAQNPQLILWVIAIVVIFLVVRRFTTTHPVSFDARKRVSVPVKFKTHTGDSVSFRARKTKRVSVNFRAKNK